MKTFFALILLLFTSVSVWAQPSYPESAPSKKFYVGIDFNVTPYYLKLNSKQSVPFSDATNFTPYPGIHAGYQVSKRGRIQIGAAYANDRFNVGNEYNNNGVIEGNYRIVKTKGFVIPVSFRYNFLDVSQCFQAYGFASLTTAYAHSTSKIIITRDGLVSSSSKTNGNGVGLYLGVGLGMSHQINNRFRVFGEYSVINRNLTGCWVPDRRGLDINLLNLGLNYPF